MRATPILLGAILIAATAAAGETYGPYRATVLRVIDGDTVELAVRIWPDLVQTTRLRLADVDTPELRAKSPCERALAEEAKAFTESVLAGVDVVTVSEVRPGSFAGRMLGRIEVRGQDLSQALMEKQLGRTYNPGDKTPWCREDGVDGHDA